MLQQVLLYYVNQCLLPMCSLYCINHTITWNMCLNLNEFVYICRVSNHGLWSHHAGIWTMIIVIQVNNQDLWCDHASICTQISVIRTMSTSYKYVYQTTLVNHMFVWVLFILCTVLLVSARLHQATLMYVCIVLAHT